MKVKIYNTTSVLFLSLFSIASVYAEDAPFNLAKSIGLPDSIVIDGSIRSRYEYADWFNAGKEGIDNSDSFSTFKSQLGVAYKQDDFKLYMQGEYDQVFGLSRTTDNGVSALYRSFNDGESSPDSVYLRQAYAQFPNINDSGLSLLAGRFLYSGGAELGSENVTLQWLKKNRVSERLIGPFDFTFGRSFDGGRADYAIKEVGTLTMSAFHPTQGGFKTNGMDTISDIAVMTAVGTHQYKVDNGNEGEIQFFYYRYYDDRAVIKTDNRALDVRKGDMSNIAINNYGAHLINSAEVANGTWESVLWGVLQEGDWGDSRHLAQAFAVETGYRLDEVFGKPWIRAGLNWGSGDSDPGDGKHGTLFQMLPTTRIYALTPFYNMMNMQDLFVQGIWKPFEKVTLRADLHHLSTANDKDLFYAGAGANSRNGAFGYSGTPTNGESSVGTLIDGSIGVEINKHVGLNLYYGYLISGDIPEQGYGKNDSVEYGFFELVCKL